MNLKNKIYNIFMLFAILLLFAWIFIEIKNYSNREYYLVRAVKVRDFQEIKRLFNKYYYDLNKLTDLMEISSHPQKVTPLFFCILPDVSQNEYDWDIINFMIKKGANVNLPDKFGKTLLMHAVDDRAAMSSHIADKLIKAGANPNIEDNNGNRALSYAVKNQNIKYTEILIKNGAEINYGNKYSNPLNNAVNRGNLEIADLLLKHGAKKNNLFIFNYLDFYNSTKKYKGIKFAIEQGADVNFVDKNGDTVLCEAVNNNNFDIATFLLDSGANPDINYHSFHAYGTPLHCAIFKDDYEMTELLVNKGANVDLCCYDVTPLTQSVIKENLKIVKMLLKNGANPDLPDGNGQIPLFYAVVFQKYEMSELPQTNS